MRDSRKKLLVRALLPASRTIKFLLPTLLAATEPV
jgi:hypothetical protein